MQTEGVSIVFVNYKTPDLLHHAIRSLVAFTKGIAYEIIVVDNFSQDNSQAYITEAFPFVKWINNSYNAGFARGNNAGVRAASYNYVLIINSDTLLQDDAVSLCYNKFKQLENECRIGLLGCQIKSFEGAVLPSVHSAYKSITALLQKNPLWIKIFGASRPVAYTAEWYATSHFAEHLSGAFLMFNKQQLSTTSLWLDEDFFLYYEDVEWCVRLNRLGFKQYYFADTHILHKDSGSSKSSERKNFQILISELLFVFKTYNALYYHAYVLLWLCNLWLDNWLEQRKQKHSAAIEERKHTMYLLRHYSKVVATSFKKETSKSGKMLVYDK